MNQFEQLTRYEQISSRQRLVNSFHLSSSILWRMLPVPAHLWLRGANGGAVECETAASAYLECGANVYLCTYLYLFCLDSIGINCKLLTIFKMNKHFIKTRKIFKYISFNALMFICIHICQCIDYMHANVPPIFICIHTLQCIDYMLSYDRQQL